jgi:hypothetical protein
MSERNIPVIEDPMMYVGIPKGSDHAVLVVNPGTPDEFWIAMGPMQILELSAQANFYGQKLLIRLANAVERHQKNNQIDALPVIRERPALLDS